MMRPLKNFGCATLCIVVFLASGDFAFGQMTPADSIAMRENIEGFYSWYLGLAKEGKVSADFNPLFVRKKDGMTTLDFTNYQNGLKKYGFADDLINQRIKAYDECVSNLAKTPYDTLLTFKDLDDFDLILCAFNNYYEWTADMEVATNASLSELTPIDKKTVSGQVDFYYSSSSPSGGAMITFKKIGKDWKIAEVEL